jgi:hypothetical protein
LEILVGLKAEKSKHVVQHVESPFNEDEVQALKALASRVLKRYTQQTVASNPQIIPVQTQQEQRPTAPKLNQVPEPREQVNSKPRGRPVQQPAPVKPAKPKKESAKPKMAVGEGYKPMPSMVAQNQAIAASADKINAASSNGEVGKIMSMLASAAIANNKNVQEE